MCADYNGWLCFHKYKTTYMESESEIEQMNKLFCEFLNQLIRFVQNPSSCSKYKTVDHLSLFVSIVNDMDNDEQKQYMFKMWYDVLSTTRTWTVCNKVQYSPIPRANRIHQELKIYIRDNANHLSKLFESSIQIINSDTLPDLIEAQKN